jgi:hypothetical protein
MCKSLGNLKGLNTAWIGEQCASCASIVHWSVPSAPDRKKSLGLVIDRSVDGG